MAAADLKHNMITTNPQQNQNQPANRLSQFFTLKIDSDTDPDADSEKTALTFSGR
jgi:hypothetical protein